MGELDEAAAAGAAALECGHVVWPTLVLAGKLDQSLGRRSPRDARTSDFRASYAEARTCLALPAGRAQAGRQGD